MFSYIIKILLFFTFFFLLVVSVSSSLSSSSCKPQDFTVENNRENLMQGSLSLTHPHTESWGPISNPMVPLLSIQTPKVSRLFLTPDPSPPQAIYLPQNPTTPNPLFHYLRASPARMAILAIHYTPFFILTTSFSLHTSAAHLF